MADNKLFDDSEVFQKERPTGPTEAQLKEFYLRMANEIIKEGFSTDDAESIAEDIEGLYPFNDNGFEMAKDLGNYSSKASYDIDTSFCEWLDGLSYEYGKINRQNIIEWVKAHNPQPKYPTGIAVLVDATINSKVTKGKTFYITGSRPEEAVYWLNEDVNEYGGFVVPYEIVENKCTPVNPPNK